MTDTSNSEFSDNKGIQIYNELANSLMMGERLPNERIKIRELAQLMNTSVTPVRDAVLRLVQDGAFVMHSPRDIRICSLTLDEYLEIRSIRLELEGMVAETAARLATPADIVLLETILTNNESALSQHDFKASIQHNQQFHFELCRIANMPILTDILKQLWIKIGPLIAQAYPMGGRDMIDHHYALLQSIAQKDSQAARIHMQTDILSGGEALKQWLSTNPS